MSSMNEWITTKEAAYRLGMSTSQVCRLARAGKLIGKQVEVVGILSYVWMIDPDSVAVYPDNTGKRGRPRKRISA